MTGLEAAAEGCLKAALDSAAIKLLICPGCNLPGGIKENENVDVRKRAVFKRANCGRNLSGRKLAELVEKHSAEMEQFMTNKRSTNPTPTRANKAHGTEVTESSEQEEETIDVMDTASKSKLIRELLAHLMKIKELLDRSIKGNDTATHEEEYIRKETEKYELQLRNLTTDARALSGSDETQKSIIFQLKRELQAAEARQGEGVLS